MSKAQSYNRALPPERPPAHEVKDANVKIIWLLTLFFLLSGIVMHGLLWGILKQMSNNPSPPDDWALSQPKMLASTPTASPNKFPKLQLSPESDFREFRANEERLLQSYGWVDREHGIARVPVQVAMDLVLKKGLPTRGTNAQAKTMSSPLELQQKRAQPVEEKP